MSYPDHAVEMTVTVLIPVTDENRADVDGIVYDSLNKAGLDWWPERTAEYDERGLVIQYTFNRPVQFKRPPKKRAKR